MKIVKEDNKEQIIIATPWDIRIGDEIDIGKGWATVTFIKRGIFGGGTFITDKGGIECGRATELLIKRSK